ncbi:MAG: ribonuclease H-like domain-containing protein [Methanocalculaceae archaeon]|jgi:uncharacterized protein YprB with RNaseH-like and TPR domain|nr:ribonuclease H-like domain-containing protein [Methanocalculaceae archaeon]
MLHVLEPAFTPENLLKAIDYETGNHTLGSFEVETANGYCLALESAHPLPSISLSEDRIRSRLMQELTLVHGIGPERERVCRCRGITTLEDLRQSRWGYAAKKTADVIRNGSLQEIIQLFCDAGRGEDPLLIGFGAAVPPKDLLFFDIETLDMVHSPIILFGCGVCEEDALRITQYLLRDLAEEVVALGIVAEIMRRHAALVTYNGRSFDLPFINRRLAYYGEREHWPSLHFDLLYPARYLFRGDLPNCHLETVEEYVLGCGREDDLPGYLVPTYYQQYLRTRDTKPLMQIVEHNKQDIASLVMLLAKQTEIMYGNT